MHVILHVCSYSKSYRILDLGNTVVVFTFTTAQFQISQSQFIVWIFLGWNKEFNVDSTFAYLLIPCFYILHEYICILWIIWFNLDWQFKSNCVGHMTAGFLVTPRITNVWLATCALLIVKIIINNNTLLHPISDLFIYI